MINISFIVLTYNRVDALLAVLTSLSEQCGPSHEVLIADDGSSAQSREMLFSKCPDFKCAVSHVWHPDIGFTAAHARNQAAKIAKGGYLVFLDGDCVPGSKFVREHQKLAETGFFVNGSRVLLTQRFSIKVIDQKILLFKFSYGDWIFAWIKGFTNKLFHFVPWPWRLFRVKTVFYLRGIRSCNFGLSKVDFFAVNGFDESFGGWGHEDADLALRLNHAGLRRKNGFMATEVFHLWHPENSREKASGNWQKVITRMHSRQILADKGLDNATALTPAITILFHLKAV